jgi:acetyl-CoA acetyltransferase
MKKLGRALGHPLGTSGARLALMLVHQLEKTYKTRGLATLYGGAGIGLALAVERCDEGEG